MHRQSLTLLLGLFQAIATMLIVSMVSASPLSAAELLMFERTGCVWCSRWHKDVGAIYPITDEGKKVPLRTVNIDRGVPSEFRFTPPVFYTPTFVLIENGREVGRITGYLGDDAFWGLYARMVKERVP